MPIIQLRILVLDDYEDDNAEEKLLAVEVEDTKEEADEEIGGDDP